MLHLLRLLTLLLALHLALASMAQAAQGVGRHVGLTDANDPDVDMVCGIDGPCTFPNRRAEIAAELAQLGMIDFFVPYTRIGAAVEVAGLGSGVLVKVGSKTFVRIGDRLHSFYHDESGAIRVPGVGGNAPNSGAASSVNGARLRMQLSAEEAAGVRTPTSISSYSDHALQQIAGRDGGIGVSQAAIDNAFLNPRAIQYIPSQYGPTFRYVGQDATVVVNPQGNVVTTWGTSAAGVGK